VEIVSVIDGEMRGPPSFFFGIPRAVHARPGRRSPERQRPRQVRQLSRAGGGKTVLVDTGAGPRNPAMPAASSSVTSRPSAEAGDIDIVVNTHLHVDHVGWNCSERDGAFVPTFPNAEYWIDRTEWDYWADPLNAAEEGAHITEGVLPLSESPQLRLIDGEVAITPELQLLSTPGHTPGHVSIGIASGGESAIILGDVAHHPLNLVRIWIAAVDELPRCAARSVRWSNA
jgi:glyoxylase-like metal-dependent hydrolase (beta-lactamase superfamily II)